ncbi:3-hydroxy-3-methylglutaryl coenzyme A synthase [Monosporozyma unispora]|nr:3-hydroxy-3-methylglutaryl coenzyme A synthase [Kazachstania unispora]
MTKRQRLDSEVKKIEPASNVGIKGFQIYIPTQYVSQDSLEEHDGVSKGKYTIGLGQTNMVFVNDREDIYSMALTVVNNLLTTYNIDKSTIGRLEVGTETLLDKSKSIKSVLMQLFNDTNGDIEGVDTINACYGGTNALFNAINWIESSNWDGRDAIVVCGDIAIYEKGPARPTGGAGMVAMLVGPNAPLVMDRTRASYMEHVYDFFKPDLTSEYPVVQGHYSLICYVKALDKAYANYKAKFNNGNKLTITDLFDYNVFHVPTCKLVTKSFARLLYNDWLQDHSLYPEVDVTLSQLTYEESLTDKRIEKTFLPIAKELFNARVKPSLEIPTNTGNMYTASVFASLASLLHFVGNDQLLGKTIGLFSYGSGMAASLYSFTVRDDISELVANLHLDKWLQSRTCLTPVEYESQLKQREAIHLQKDYKPVGTTEYIRSGSYYLTEIDTIYRRNYSVKE